MSDSALRVAHGRNERAGLVVVTVELRCIVEAGEHVEVFQCLPDGVGTTDAVHPTPEGFACVAFGSELAHHAHYGLRCGLGRQAGGLLTEVDLLLPHIATEQHLVAGCGQTVGSTLGTEETDVAGVVLATTVGAPRDVDTHPAHLGQAFGLERFTNGLRQATALGDCDVARVGTRAGHHIAGEFGARQRHADGLERGVQVAQLSLGEPAHGTALR